MTKTFKNGSKAEQPKAPAPGMGRGPGPSSASEMLKYLETSGVKDITLKALEQVSGRQRVVVYASWAMVVVSILGVVAFWQMNRPGFAFASIVAAALLFTLAMFIDRSLTIRDLNGPLATAAPPNPEPKRAVPHWSRLVPELPLPEGKAADLAADLQNIHNAAFTWLSRRYSAVGLRIEQVRANVFLPDYVNAERGVPCLLRIPEEFRIGMDGHPDEQIHFRPWQGLTGQVFMEQKELKYARTFPSPDGRERFEDFFELTPEQVRSLHPKLRWIVSFPLSIPDGPSRKAAGVLNVDGLEHHLSEDDLGLLWGELSPRVARFADQLALLPRVRILIQTEADAHAG